MIPAEQMTQNQNTSDRAPGLVTWNMPHSSHDAIQGPITYTNSRNAPERSNTMLSTIRAPGAAFNEGGHS